MTRIGQIGLGVWGGKVLKALASRPGVEIVWTATSHDWAHKLSTNVERTDGVVICVPPMAQPLVAKTVLENGLPVFLEKPFALSYLDARRLHDAAAMRGLPVVVDHVWLFHPLWEELKRRTAGKSFAYVSTRSGNKGPVRDWPVEHPALWDWAPHDIAMVFDLMDGEPPVSIAAINPGQYHIDLAYPSRIGGNGCAQVRTGNTLEERAQLFYVNVEGEGLYTLDGVGPKGSAVLTAPDGKEIDVVGPKPLDRALEVWLAAVRGQEWDPRVGTTFPLKIIRALELVGENIRGY